MRIQLETLNLSNPLCPRLFERYIGSPRASLIHHETIIDVLKLAVYFRPADELKDLSVVISAQEIPKLLILEVNYFLNLFNCRDKLAAKHRLPEFMNAWWDINGERFCPSFCPLINRDHNKQECVIMHQAQTLLANKQIRAYASVS